MELKNKHFVITIARECGTGGHKAGEMIARHFGVKLIDKQILGAVAEKFHITEEDARKLDEKRPSWWDDFASFYRSFTDIGSRHENRREVTSRQIFNAQAAAIRRIAKEESCVVIGRCGFHIFKDNPQAVKFFLHASKAARVERVMKKNTMSEADALQMIDDYDYSREVYTRTFTGKAWQDARNYDLTLDVSNMSVDRMVEMMIRFVEEK